MTFLGDVCRARRHGRPQHCFSIWGQNNRGLNVIVTISGGVPLTILNLETIAGQLIYRSRSDTSGVTKFYDLDDGQYRAYGGGEQWRITITLGVATVVKEFSAKRTSAVGYMF